MRYKGPAHFSSLHLGDGEVEVVDGVVEVETLTTAKHQALTDLGFASHTEEDEEREQLSPEKRALADECQRLDAKVKDLQRAVDAERNENKKKPLVAKLEAAKAEFSEKYRAYNAID